MGETTPTPEDTERARVIAHKVFKKVCELSGAPTGHMRMCNDLTTAIAAAIAAERERNAVAAIEACNQLFAGPSSTSGNIAAAIRKGGE